jgi:uncharacterized cupredoxin-like copper-binding protein
MLQMRRLRSLAVLAVALCSAALVTVAGAWAGSAGSSADSEIAVTLGRPGEYGLKTSARTARSGEVEFIVQNRGKLVHEFILLRTPVKAAKLKPRPDEPQKVVEPGFRLELEDLEPGQRVIVALPLKAGHYVLLCNLEGHYAAGMRADLTLK